MRFPLKRRNGFTMIELLMVIAITGVLAAMLIVAIGKAREASAKAKTVNNLRQIGSAVLEMVGSAPRGELPPTFGAYPDMGFPFGTEVPDPADRTGRKKKLIPTSNYGSVFYYLLPRLQNENLFNELKNQGVPLVEKGAENCYTGIVPPKKRINSFLSDSDPCQDTNLGLVSFVTNNQVFVGGAYNGANTVLPQPYTIDKAKGMINDNNTPTFGGNPDVPRSNLIKMSEITQRVGSGNCAFVTERNAVSSDAREFPHFWASPNLTFDSTGNEMPTAKAPYQVLPTKGTCLDRFAHANFSSGIHVLMGDGAVRTVAPAVSQKSWQTAFNPSTTESLDSDF